MVRTNEDAEVFAFKDAEGGAAFTTSLHYCDKGKQ